MRSDNDLDESRGARARRALSNTPRLVYSADSPDARTALSEPAEETPLDDEAYPGDDVPITHLHPVAAVPCWPPTLNSFGMVGQEVLSAQLDDQVDYAAAMGRRFPDRLLVGPPGVGKSTLARALARKLVDGGCVLLSASDCSNPGEFIQALGEHGLLSNGGEGDGAIEKAIVFIDECHALPSRFQDWLLSATDDERAASYKGEVYRFKQMTFLLATTDPGLLTPAFQSRFDALYLRAYTLSELAGIVWLHARSALDGAELSEDACLEIACRMRVQPRRSVKALQNNLVPHAFSRVRSAESPTPGGAELAQWLTASNIGAYFDGIGIDLNGIDGQARGVLSYLARNGVVASNRLKQALSLTTDQDFLVLDEYLIRLGLVGIGARGRMLTPAGKRYLSDPVSLRSRIDNPTELSS